MRTSQYYYQAPTKVQQTLVRDIPHVYFGKIGRQHCPSADGMAKTNQAHNTPKHSYGQGTSPYPALPLIQRDKIQLHSQNTGTTPSNQEGTGHKALVQPHPWGQILQLELWPPSLQKGNPKHSKPNKMKRQRNTQQMKQHEKNPQDHTNEEETGSLPEKEFRVMVVRIIWSLGNNMETQIKTKVPDQ